jgi:LCP family protein required for cell wall assembly
VEEPPREDPDLHSTSPSEEDPRPSDQASEGTAGTGDPADDSETASPEADDPTGVTTDPDDTGSPWGDIGTPDGGETGTPPDGRPLSVTAALLSALITGAGHWLVGNLRRGMWFFLPVGIIVVGGLLFTAIIGRAEVASMSVQPAWLWAFLTINLVILAVRMFATFDAHRLGRPPTSQAWMGPAGLALALLLTAGPHLWVASYNLTWIDTLETVFDAPVTTATTDPTVYAGPETSTTTTSPATTTSTTEPRVVGVPPLDLPNIPLPDNEFLPLEGLTDGRYLSILLAGGDAGPGRGGLRTDTMIVATLDLEMNKAFLFGISRELVHIPIPSAWDDAFEELEDTLWEQELREWIQDQNKKCRNGSEWKENPPDWCPELLIQPERCECFPDRLNAIYTYTRNWTHTFPDSPDPGMEALRRAMQRVLAIPIDYYVLVDMAGFVALVDALGGIDIWVTESIHGGFSPAVEGGDIVRVDVEPGFHHLDGNESLAYVRSRAGASDAERIRRQRCAVRSVAAAADPLDILWRFNDIAAAIRDNTITNIPLDFLPELVRVSVNMSLDDIVTVALTGSRYYDGEDFREIPMPDLPNIRYRVRTALDGSAPGDSEGDDGECGGPTG